MRFLSLNYALQIDPLKRADSGSRGEYAGVGCASRKGPPLRQVAIKGLKAAFAAAGQRDRLASAGGNI